MLKQVVLGVSLATLSCTVIAQTVNVTGSITTGVEVTSPRALANAANGAPAIKNVKLMKLNLSAAQKQKIMQAKTNIKAHSLSNTKSSQQDLPSYVDVGMNGVPVLDQGAHGTCATFANTAAVDAILGKGDYISQLCQLAVGSYIERRSYSLSGWDGSYGPYVLNQMLHYGVTSKAKQVKKRCGGLTQYPVEDEYETGRPMTLDAFKTISENLSDEKTGSMFYWRSILDVATRFEIDNSLGFDPDNVLAQVKQSLAVTGAAQNNESSITFGVMLPYEHCSAGACARRHKRNDTWALTQEILDDNYPEIGGHEMVITGYDDNAIAKDKDGVEHKGLLTIRNSWSEDVGDNGNFYMTYDYFKMFVMEVQKVSIAKNTQSN